MRLSTYYGPDSTDLTELPELRSMYQQYIGQQNIELKLDKLAKDPQVQASIAQMNQDLREGRREREPMKAYHHNKKIRKIFNDARMRAWAKMKQNSEVQAELNRQRQLEIENKRTLKQTQGLLLQNK